jgi:hypothetical protein
LTSLSCCHPVGPVGVRGVWYQQTTQHGPAGQQHSTMLGS